METKMNWAEMFKKVGHNGQLHAELKKKNSTSIKSKYVVSFIRFNIIVLR